MDIAMFKAQAVRLAQHLAAKHGFTLKHAAALEAVAALHGARDWNTLAGEAGKDGRSEAIERITRITHTLVFGAPDLGAAVLLEQMALRHVAGGGGLLYVSDRPDAALAEVLRQAAAEAPHQPQFLSLAPPNEKGVQTCAPRLDALVQSGYLLHLAPTAGQASSAAHAGTCMLLAQLGTVLAARQGAERRRPLLVVLPAARFDMSWLALLLRQGRALGVSFVLQADTPAALGRMGAVFANTVLANVGAQLFLTPADGRALEYAAAHMAATSGVALAQARQALSAVGPGAALRLAGERLELIRYDGKPAGRSPQ